MSLDLTPRERSALAAVSYVLDRACIHRRELDEQEQRDEDTGEAGPRDPGLGYYLSPHTEAWGRLVRAEAALLGESERAHELYRADCWDGRGDPDAPYRGLDIPGEHAWSQPVHGYRWAADRYMLVREDCKWWPPKARGHHWMDGPPVPSIEALVPRRSECSPERPSGYENPHDDVGRRLDAVRSGATLLWSSPRGGIAEGRPVLAAFSDGDEWPFVVCMPRLEGP